MREPSKPRVPGSVEAPASWSPSQRTAQRRGRRTCPPGPLVRVRSFETTQSRPELAKSKAGDAMRVTMGWKVAVGFAGVLVILLATVAASYRCTHAFIAYQ